MAAVLLLAAGCALREPRPQAAWLDERAELFAGVDAWSVSGRLGLSDGERGGSLSFRWHTEGDRHRVDLSTMTGGRRWILEFGPGGAVLQGSQDPTVRAPRPEPLVEEAVGWYIPVTLMVDWLRGLPAPPSAELDWAADGTLAGLGHRDWTLTFDDWQRTDGVLLPDRITARSGRYRVRAALRGWTLERTER